MFVKFLKAFFFVCCVFLKAETDSFPLNDHPIEYHFELPKGTYHQYCKNFYSQNGEDGILEKLLSELGITKGTFCEFGASDGITSSNTYNLIKNHGFTGVSIESDFELYRRCVDNYRQFQNIQIFHGAVLYYDSMNSLDSWLHRANLPSDFDLLSIDIDCDDYYVWEKLTDFQPKIVIFETNSYRDPVFEELPRKKSSEYNIDPLPKWNSGRVALGCSFISAVKLGLKKGYVPVSYTGNLIFVRKDLISQLTEFPYIVSDDPYDYLPLYTHLCLWKNRWYTNTGLIFNVAIRDYYLTFKEKKIDLDWINKRSKEILNLIEP